MRHVSIQIQSVLFRNSKRSLDKAIEALANAIQVAKIKGELEIDAKVSYGDASPEPVFKEREISEKNSKWDEFLQISYNYFGFNSGSAKGHNILAESCKAEYMMIMNPDVIVSPRFFVEMFKPFENPQIGMVEARQTPIEHPKEYNIKTKETDWATTACVIFPTKIFKQLNGFDAESFFMYCDDLDFSWRMRLEGYKIFYQPLAPVYHAKRLSTEAKWQPTEAEIYYSAEAALMMAYKYSNEKLLKQIINSYSNSRNSDLVRAVESFEQRKEKGQLPVQLDRQHKVAKFVGNMYTEHRFEL